MFRGTPVNTTILPYTNEIWKAVSTTPSYRERFCRLFWSKTFLPTKMEPTLRIVIYFLRAILHKFRISTKLPRSIIHFGLWPTCLHCYFKLPRIKCLEQSVSNSFFVELIYRASIFLQLANDNTSHYQTIQLSSTNDTSGMFVYANIRCYICFCR